MGLNCSMGLAYGITQFANLSGMAIKFLFNTMRLIAGKLFDSRHVTNLVKFVMKMVFGAKFKNTSNLSSQINNLEYLEKMWQ